jgi:hypothetical protein
LGPLSESSNTLGDSKQVEAETIVIEASKDDAIQEESSEDEVDLVDAAGWATIEVY